MDAVGTTGARAKRRVVIREPKLLPFYMDAETTAALCGVSRETVEKYCQRGVWKRGTHYTQPSRRRVFHRDAVLAWLNESSRSAPMVDVGKSNVNLSRSPDLAAEIARDRCRA